MIEEFLEIIQEGRKEDFVSRFRTKFPQQQLDRIVNLIKPKYLDWVGRVFDGTNFEENFIKLTDSLRRFDQISSNLPKTDIYQYKSLSDLITELEKYKNKNRRTVQVAEDTNLVYDDGRFVVVNPLSHKSSCIYGKGTKWCTTSSSNEHFNKYNDDGKLFYIFDKSLPTDDPKYKLALLKKFAGEEFLYDAKNNLLRSELLQDEIYKNMMTKIDSYFNEEFQEQLKIFKDKELAKKEKERLERLRIRRRYLELEEEAQDRRTEQEWSLTNENIDEEGLKAHALFQMLEHNNDITSITPQEIAKLSEYKTTLEDLESELVRLGNTDEDTSELEDRIDEIKEEIEYLETKVDVYILVPTGEYYLGMEFEILNPDLQDRKYAVFDENEIHQTCEEYVENLIDDVGIAGLNPNFAKGYLDIETIADHAYDIYNEDVYNNPEVYLDESDRELSSRQESTIELNNKKIEDAENLIQELEEFEVQNDSNSEKIEELNEMIQELKDEIDEINDNPDGEYNSDAIDEKVDDLVSHARKNPEFFLEEMGLNWEEFVNKSELIEGMIDADGYGLISNYDGTVDEEEVLGETYYIVRID